MGGVELRLQAENLPIDKSLLRKINDSKGDMICHDIRSLLIKLVFATVWKLQDVPTFLCNPRLQVLQSTV